jgi:hypothetical protein
MDSGKAASQLDPSTSAILESHRPEAFASAIMAGMDKPRTKSVAQCTLDETRYAETHHREVTVQVPPPGRDSVTM